MSHPSGNGNSTDVQGGMSCRLPPGDSVCIDRLTGTLANDSAWLGCTLGSTMKGAGELV